MRKFQFTMINKEERKMLSGYTGKMLFVDLTKRKVRVERPEEKLYRDFIGGNGLGGKILFNRQKAGVDPLGPENMLGFVTGPLTGTPALLGNRFMVVGKSPLTGTFGNDNAGGCFGPHLKFAGYDGIFFSGASAEPVYLFVDNRRAEIKDAGHLWGKATVDTEEILRKKHGKEAKVLSIGSAGERLSLISCIIDDCSREAGRSGLGAVMGSKKLKAIAVIGSQKIPLADEEKLKKLSRRCLGELSAEEMKLQTELGDISCIAEFVYNGAFPVKNWGGVGIRDLPNAGAISDTNIDDLRDKIHGCYGCPIACGGMMKAGTEYPYEAGSEMPKLTVYGSFGSMCLNDNLESIIMANDICNRSGLDSISTGATIAFAMECYENGIVSKQDTDGIELTWGNHRAIVAMTEKIAKGEGFGAVLADGVKAACERIGKGAEEFAIHIHGQEPGMADPKIVPTMAVQFVTEATPGRDTLGGIMEDLPDSPVQGVDFPPIERYAYSGKAWCQVLLSKFYHVMEASGMCITSWESNLAIKLETIQAELAAVTGWEYSIEELLRAGERIRCNWQAFNVREGLKPSDFKLPPRVIGHPPLKEGPCANVTVDVDNMVRELFEFMDWDLVTGKPSRQKLFELGLVEEAKDLWPET
jgi:aldehyde:ferredoxin oxidoreductase